ncbi:Rz-like spanin [Morganella phage vB_Mm5]
MILKMNKLRLFQRISATVLLTVLFGCSSVPPTPDIKPALPAKVTPVDIKFIVIGEVKNIDGKEYLITPFKGQPLVAMTYPDSLLLRSFLNDVKRQKDQYGNILCHFGYDTLCAKEKKSEKYLQK